MKLLLINKLTPKNVEVRTLEVSEDQFKNIITIQILDYDEARGERMYSYQALLSEIDLQSLVYMHCSGNYLYIFEHVPETIKKYYLKVSTQKSKKQFPYKFISKNYNAHFAMETFQKQIKARSITLSKQADLSYTFGVEYETSAGIIPEHECFHNGLIPVYDGSISGIEYASVVLKGKLGLQTLRNQFKLYKNYSDINSDCSIHVHLGGMPQSFIYAYFLNACCYNLETSIKQHTHPFVFDSDMYKNTGKNYASRLINPTFSGYYVKMSDTNMVTLCDWTPTNQHVADERGNAKWHIHQRYHWLNVINLLYYDKNKTVEFRFLPSTYNVEKLIGWIYIFNAIAKQAEEMYNTFINQQPLNFEKEFYQKLAPNDLSAITTFVKTYPIPTSLQALISNVYTDYNLLLKLNIFLDLQQTTAKLITNPPKIDTLPEIDNSLFKNFTFEKTK